MKLSVTSRALLPAIFVSLPITMPQAVAQERMALEEVIVTARKREQSLQDVSVAVTALTDTAIAEAQIYTSEDLVQLVPSLTFQQGSNPRQSSFNIRGIGTQSFSTGVEPSVSTMLDGVVMGRSGQAFMQLLDVERVEVLRGPQGTLFGKNASAGVLHIITKDPTEEFSGEVMAGAAENNEYRAGATIAGPITDNLGFRLSASGSDVDGWIKNYYDGEDLNNSKDYSVRGKLRWDVSDTVQIKWSSDYSDLDCNCTVSTIRSLEPFNGNDAQIQGILDEIDPVQVGEENIETNVNSENYTDWESWGHALEVNWDIGEFTLTSITAYREFSVAASIDNDNRPTTPLGFDQDGGTEQEQFTQELRLASPASDRLNYVVGLYYFDQKVSRQFRRSFEFAPGLPGVGISTFAVDTTNWAAFGEINYSFNDAWRMVLGARYTQDDLKYVFGRTREGLAVGIPAPVEPTPGETDNDDLSGKLALEWSFNDDAMLYASYSQGYKGPAYDVTFGTDPTTLEPVDPETSDAYELGMKSVWFDNRLILNAALFMTEFENFQGQAFFDPDGDPGCAPDNPGCDPDDQPGSFLLVNAGEVETKGLEVDFTALVTDNFRLYGGFAFIDAEITDYRGGNCSFGQTFRGECPDGTQDLSGGVMPHSPDWKVALTAQYNWELPTSFDLILQGTYKAQDDVLYSLSQDEFTWQDGYGTLDLSAKLADRDARWEATVYVKNATDEWHVSGIGSNISQFLPNGYIHSVPLNYQRRFGAEVRFRW
ncbi:TonB-dependent receptor [Halieaceae bacterium IMCC14734]|uniref:TonB-dependent receptor n=1 Tax=Candidatus Litorirhabdus singularis TaxID=2518993 RepID=A0ABT3TFB6_9GAMM|nr:TonB-dependent receptor [Candidatus Litorirhabdus singularis]MCX2980102.1 TonB-dependent receptor [Candidatus Litorirhabdus singularis]